MSDELTPDQEHALKVAVLALARGGHADNPGWKIVHAAMAYVVRESLSRMIVDCLEAEEIAMRWDPERRELLVLLEPGKGDEAPMIVARLSKRGRVRFT